MLRAWILGFSLLLAVYLAWFLYVYFGWFPRMQNANTGDKVFWIVCLFPGVSAMLSSLIAPRRKLIIGMSMAISGAVLVTLINYATELSGIAMDYFGVKSGIELFVLIVTWNLIPCALGTAVGTSLAKFARA